MKNLYNNVTIKLNIADTISKEVKELIQKYRNGYQPPQQGGKSIEAKDIFDYETFFNYCKNKIKNSSIKTYMTYLHQWVLPLNEQNLRDFDGSIDLIDEKRHDYKTPEKRRFIPAYTQKSEYYKKRSNNRLAYFMRRALFYYFKATNQDELIEYLPDTKELNHPKHIPKLEYLTYEQMMDTLEQFQDQHMKLFCETLFFTGGRVSEMLHFKKHSDWLRMYIKGKKIKIDKDEVFEITLPIEFAKADQMQTMFINNQDLIEKLIEHLNNVGHNDYVFMLHSDLNSRKNYKDIEKEKYKFRCALDDALRSAGLSNLIGKITIHSIRRSYIHHIYEEYDHDLNFTSQAARHTSGVDITGKYLETKKEEIKKRFQEKM